MTLLKSDWWHPDNLQQCLDSLKRNHEPEPAPQPEQEPSPGIVPADWEEQRERQRVKWRLHSKELGDVIWASMRDADCPMDKADMAELGCRTADCWFALMMRNLLKGWLRKGYVYGSVSFPAHSVVLSYPVGIALGDAKKVEVVRGQLYGGQ